MNTNYYQNPIYPVGNELNAMQNIASSPNSGNMLSIEQSYVENILRMNKGKLATFYFSYPDSVDCRDKTYRGIIEAAGRDHIIVSDPETGRWYLLLMIYLDYVDFDEKINYSPSYYPNNNIL